MPSRGPCHAPRVQVRGSAVIFQVAFSYETLVEARQPVDYYSEEVR